MEMGDKYSRWGCVIYSSVRGSEFNRKAAVIAEITITPFLLDEN
jgi:hypothetical protein